VLGYPSPLTGNPTSVPASLPVDWQVPDVLKLRLADDEAMTANVRTLSHALGDADAGSISIGIPTLSVPTWFHAYGAHSGIDSANVSNKVKWGETTPPTITTNATPSQMELFPLVLPLMANETIAKWEIVGGSDQTQFDISASTLRWFENGTQNFDVPADINQNNSYVVIVRATDLAGNTTDATITVTVSAADKMPSAFSYTDILPSTPSTTYHAGPSYPGTSSGSPISGLTPGLQVPCSLSGGGEYSIDGGGSWHAAGVPFTRQNGDALPDLRVTTGPGATTVLNLALNIGLGSYTWMVSNANSSSTRWRLLVTGSQANTGAVIAEIEMRGSIGGPDLTSGGTAVASSEYDGTFLAANGFDGNTANAWASTFTGLPQWLEYQFPSAVTINQVAITSQSGNQNNCVENGKIQYWDGAAWQDWIIISGSTLWGATETRTFS
jgi:hypothetical protein